MHTHTHLYCTFSSVSEHTTHRHTAAFKCTVLHVSSEWECAGHLGSVILSLSHFSISAWLMEEETKLIGPSLWGRGLLWARLRARSSFCLLGIVLTFPFSLSSSSSSSSFRKELSLRIMMSGDASFSLSNHKTSEEVSCGACYQSKSSTHTNISSHKRQYSEKERAGTRDI